MRQGTAHNGSPPQVVRASRVCKNEEARGDSTIIAPRLLVLVLMCAEPAYSNSACESGCGCAGPLMSARRAGSLSSRQRWGKLQKRRMIMSLSAIRDFRGIDPSLSAISISRTRHFVPCGSATSRLAPRRSRVTVRRASGRSDKPCGSPLQRYQNCRLPPQSR